MSINKRTFGAQHNRRYVASDGTAKPVDMRRAERAEKTRALYAKQRVLCGSIQIAWQQELVK